MGTHGNAPSGSVLRGNVAFAFRGTPGVSSGSWVARVTTRIQRPGVPQIYDAVLDESYERLYLVMELADGIPFGDYVDADWRRKASNPCRATVTWPRCWRA
ncbi:hypothetical protein ACH4VM_36000 [Streptomyces sp. NPDC020792]|uniref:hypothetical protein n=1 Tax=Streptomyces sp. NPDC020792 TaxID=3365089 RepID=UPI0037ABC8D8